MGCHVCLASKILYSLRGNMNGQLPFGVSSKAVCLMYNHCTLSKKTLLGFLGWDSVCSVCSYCLAIPEARIISLYPRADLGEAGGV